MIVFDVNGLKNVNDTLGHQAGDRYIQGASRIICDIFKHSPVFRVGGDEFVVIAQGFDDYTHLDERRAEVERYNAKAIQSHGIVIACGMARLAGDASMDAVFQRADHAMYENKAALKASEAEL